MSLSTDFDYVFAVPGNTRSIIDTVRADGRSAVYGETLEQIQRRNPGAVRMPWSEWQTAAIAAQVTPITWEPSTEAQYFEMLNVLPPIGWTNGAFCVGEASDHCVKTGRPRYTAYRQIGDRFLVSSRPVTLAEFRSEMA